MYFDEFNFNHRALVDNGLMVFKTLFGGGASKPKLETVTPIEKIVQSDDEKSVIYKSLAKRKKASVLNQLTQANIRQQKLGAVA